jgi:uncharacterized protein (TIGR03086 family)
VSAARTDPAASAHAIELLERSLGYTRAGLILCPTADQHARTPCAGWDLSALLAHMEESLDAIIEMATGSLSLVPSDPDPDVTGRVERLQLKACDLLGRWSGEPPAASAGSVLVHNRVAPTPLLLTAASLEIAVHGWDVHTSVGSGVPFPETLARDLLPVVPHVVDPRHFASPIPPTPLSSAAASLLGLVGRSGLGR